MVATTTTPVPGRLIQLWLSQQQHWEQQQEQRSTTTTTGDSNSERQWRQQWQRQWAMAMIVNIYCILNVLFWKVWQFIIYDFQWFLWFFDDFCNDIYSFWIFMTLKDFVNFQYSMIFDNFSMVFDDFLKCFLMILCWFLYWFKFNDFRWLFSEFLMHIHDCFYNMPQTVALRSPEKGVCTVNKVWPSKYCSKQPLGSWYIPLPIV